MLYPYIPLPSNLYEIFFYFFLSSSIFHNNFPFYSLQTLPMASQQSHPRASNLLMILLMPQQVSPTINDDIYPGNKTTLQVPLGCSYAPSCESGPLLGVGMAIGESLTPPHKNSASPKNSASLWC